LFDEYLNIDESTVMKYLKNFAIRVIEVFEVFEKKIPLGLLKCSGKNGLRKPTQADIDRLLQVAEAHDFFGELRSSDCIH